jgi:hypothetical protein
LGFFSTTKKKKKTPEAEEKTLTTPRMSLPPIQLSMNGGGSRASNSPSSHHSTHRTGAPKDDSEEEDVFHSPDAFLSADAMRAEASLYFNGAETEQNAPQSRVSFHPSTNGTPGPSRGEEERDLMTFTPAAKDLVNPSSLRGNRCTNSSAKKSPSKVGTRSAPHRTFVPVARAAVRQKYVIQTSRLRMPPPPLTRMTPHEDQQRSREVDRIIQEFHTNPNVRAEVMPRESPLVVDPAALNRRSWIMPPPPPSGRPTEMVASAPEKTSNSNKRRSNDETDPMSSESEATNNSAIKRKKVAFASTPLLETVDERASPPGNGVEVNRKPYTVRFDPIVEQDPEVTVFPTVDGMADADDLNIYILPLFDLLLLHDFPPRPPLSLAVVTAAVPAEDERLLAEMAARRQPPKLFSTEEQMADEAPAVNLPTSGWGNLFGSTPYNENNSWKCPSCLIQNFNTIAKCPACCTLKPGTKAASAPAPSAAAPASSSAPTHNFSFGVTPAATNGSAAPAVTTAAPTTVTFGVSGSSTAAVSTVFFGLTTPSSTGPPSSTVSLGATEKCAATTDAPSSAAAPTFSFGGPAQNRTDAPSATTAPTFSFLSTTSAAVTTSESSAAPSFSFTNNSSLKKEPGAPVANGAETNDANAPSSVAATFSFGSTATKAPDALSTDPNTAFGASQTNFNGLTRPPDGSSGAATNINSSFSSNAETSAANTLVPSSTGGFSFGAPSSGGGGTTRASDLAPAPSMAFSGNKFGSGATTSTTSFGSMPSESPSFPSSHPPFETPAAQNTANLPSQPFPFGLGTSFNPSSGNGTTLPAGITSTFTSASTFGDSSSRNERIEDQRSSKKKRRDPATDSYSLAASSFSSTDIPPPSFGGAVIKPNTDATGNGSSLFNFGQPPVTTAAAQPNAASAAPFVFGASSSNTTVPSFGSSTLSGPTFGAQDPSTTAQSTFSSLPPAGTEAFTPSVPPPSQTSFGFGGAANPASYTATPGNPSATFVFGSSNTSSSAPPLATSTPATTGFGTFPSGTPAAAPLFGVVSGNAHAFGMSSGMDTMESSGSFPAPAPFAPTSGFPTPAFGASAPQNPFTPNVGGFGPPQPPAPSTFGFNAQPPAFGVPAPTQFTSTNTGGFGSAPAQGFEGGFQLGSGGGSTKRRVVRVRRPH